MQGSSGVIVEADACLCKVCTLVMVDGTGIDPEAAEMAEAVRTPSTKFFVVVHGVVKT